MNKKYYCTEDNGNYKRGEVYTLDSETNSTFLLDIFLLPGQYFCIQDNGEFKAGKVYANNDCLNSSFIHISKGGYGISSEKLLCVKNLEYFNSFSTLICENDIIKIKLYCDFSFSFEIIPNEQRISCVNFNKVYHHFISLAEYRNRQIDEILN